jgi:hypothetical protein
MEGMMSNINHQRKGAISNSAVGRSFEDSIKQFWLSQGIELFAMHPIILGTGDKKKNHRFDFGCNMQKILVECKSHRWTEGNNIPSAKLTVWNEAMYYFSLCPPEYRKIFCILRDYSIKRQMTLAQYYLQTYEHLIPQSVEFWEFCEDKITATQIY